MAKVKEIYAYLDSLAPFSLQMSFDNAGFLVGHGNSDVDGIMVALDITDQVIQEAWEANCQLIVSHHPIIFHPARSITDGDPTGRCLLTLAEYHIAAICAHTNLDAVAGGVGACGDMLEDAAALGCDTFVTADVKYNAFLDARAMGINLIDAGHFSTEDVVCPVLADWLEKGFPNLRVLRSQHHKEVFSCL